jgi:transposase
MAKLRPPYAPAFRQQMIELVAAGRTPEELAQEFEPSAQTIRNWVAQAERDAGQRRDGLTSAEHEELRRRRQEIRQLREEREILAKAAAGFARGPWLSGKLSPHRGRCVEQAAAGTADLQRSGTSPA